MSNKIKDILLIINYILFTGIFLITALYNADNQLIILVICISLGNFNYINFLNRKYEFGVLSAIGYKKSALYFKLWKENSTVCFLGYIVGILLRNSEKLTHLM